LSSPQGSVGGENPLAGIDSRGSDTKLLLWLEEDDDAWRWAGPWLASAGLRVRSKWARRSP
jgi:hypothetical protein